MTSTEPAPKQPQRIFPADFRPFVEATAQALGDGWTPDTEQPATLMAYLTHPDGRRIGIKHLWRGQAVQTWATDVPPRSYANEDDAEVMAANAIHLTEGTRYNVGVAFAHTPPAAITAKTIRARLLPAYDGKRPILRAFPRRRPRAAAKEQSAPTATPDPKKKPSSRSRTVTPAGSRTPRAKKSEPETKKTAAAPKPRSSRKPRAAKAQPTTTPPAAD